MERRFYAIVLSMADDPDKQVGGALAQGALAQGVLAHDRQIALAAVVAAGIALAGMLLVNVGSGSEARFLLEAMMPSVRFLCSAVMTASATVLALMLTLISFSSGQDQRLKREHYDRVRQIALVDTWTFAAAIVLLLIISVPLAEAAEIPASWYSVVYYVTVVYAAALGGALIAIVLMLYRAITDLIGVIHPDEVSDLVEDQEA